MISWARANGAYVKEGIHLGYDDFGVRGVFTREHIKVNEVISVHFFCELKAPECSQQS